MDTYHKRHPWWDGAPRIALSRERTSGNFHKFTRDLCRNFNVGWTYYSPDKGGRHGIEEKQ